MSLANYTDLQTAIGVWREQVGSTVIVGNAADCITLGEAELTRSLPLRIMWTNTDLTGTTDSRELDLPTDFAEPKWLKLTSSSSFCELRKETAEAMQYYSTSGTPSEWCINGDHIDLNRPCSSGLTFQFRYRAKYALSEAHPTNWLLTNHPDIYLGMVLIWSGLLIKDEDVQFWAQKTSDAINKLKILDAKADADVDLRIDPALVRNNGGWGYTTDSWWV